MYLFVFNFNGHFSLFLEVDIYFIFKSVAVSDAAYDSSWYMSSPNIKRMIQMAIMRSNKPLLLTIGPFNPLTTQTVISVRINVVPIYEY